MVQKKKSTASQNYPRIQGDHNGLLDDSRLQPHEKKISGDQLRKIIISAIKSANQKSSRAILCVPDATSEEKFKDISIKAGKELFKYFVKYYGDPAATALSCYGHHYMAVAREQFRNRTLQKERMNSGWRYQFIAKDGASQSGRFLNVSDLGTSEADFSVSIRVFGHETDSLGIYVSVKNWVNTMGGQDWPKAIAALEEVAKNDRNRVSPYLCVFGIAMERGGRLVKEEQKTGRKFSHNTEIWKSDFFWPFFTNYAYDEIIRAVLDVLMKMGEKDNIDIEIPEELLNSFGDCCREHGLLDNQGCFHDPHLLVDLFVGNKAKKKR